MAGRSIRTELFFPIVLSGGPKGAQFRWVLDIDEDGNLLVQNKEGDTIMRVNIDTGIDGHGTFNDGVL